MIRTPSKTKPSLSRSSLTAFALEPRILFDGAAAATAADAAAPADNQVIDNDSGAIDQQTQSVIAAFSDLGASNESNPTTDATSAGDLFAIAATTDSQALTLTDAKQQAEQLIIDFVRNNDASQWFELFNGGQASADAEWNAHLDQLLTAIDDGSFKLNIVEMDAASQFTAIAAYTREGPYGEPTVFINRYWFDMFDTTDATRALVEEFGHAVDDYLNPNGDTAGDEGQQFAAIVLGSAPSEGFATGSESGQVWVNGRAYDVEFAAFNFVNAYSMVYDLNNNSTADGSGNITSGIDVTERWADKEQNSHYFNTQSLGAVTIDDNNYNSRYFSGNDVSAIGINIGGVDYYGWVSRPIKSGGVVRGFYFWTDADFNNNGSREANLLAAQNDGNQDGDSNVKDNKGFLLVVDQAWFNNEIQTKTQYTINNAKDGNLGTISVDNIGSSSDRVDTALNSLIVPNGAPTPANDNLTVDEDSGATTVSAANGLLKNDTDPNGDTLTVTAFSVGGVSTTVDPTSGGTYSITNVGSITINKDGSYTFTPVANYNGPVPPITYSISDGQGGSATAVLSITVAPANDAPLATDDSVTTSQNTPKILSISDFGTYSDFENDPLAKIQITSLPTHGTLQYWDGSAWQMATGTPEFTATQILSGYLRFVPAAGENDDTNPDTGYDSIQFKVSDGSSYSAGAYTLTVFVTPGNAAPVAVADTSSVTEAGYNVESVAATGNVLTDGTDDSDPENQTLTVSAITYDGYTKSVSGSTTIKGQYGTLTINPDGSYSYALDNTLTAIDTINSGDSRTETFSYTVTDGTDSTTATLTLTINGTNDAPVAVDDFSTFVEDTNASAGNHGTVTGNALTNDTDVDNNHSDIKVALIDGDTLPGASDINLNASSPITAVTLVITQISGSWTAIVPTSPAQSVWLNAGYTTPALDKLGNQLTAYRSGSGGSATLVFSDNVALYNYENISLYIKDPGNSNFTQISVDITSTTTSASATISTTADISNIQAGYEVSGSGIPVGTTVISVDSANKTITLSQSVNIANASLIFHDPNSLTITSTQEYFQGDYGYLILNEDGSYTYTLTSDLAADQVVTEQFTYTIKDPANVTDTAVITIRVTGVDAPKLANDTLVVSEDSGAHVTFNGNAGDAATDTLKTNDANGTIITLGDVTSFTVAGDVTIYNAGSTATISGVGTLSITATGTIAFNPVDGYLGPVPSVTYTRTGSDSLSYTAALSISIQAEDNPSEMAADNQTVAEDATATGNVLVNDSDVDSTLSVTQFAVNGVTTTLSAGSGSYTINGVGTLTLNSNGNYSFVPVADWNGNVPQITYTTNTGLSSTLEITVSPGNDAPALDLDGNNSSTATGSDFKQSYTNNAAGVPIADADTLIVDIDDTAIESVTIVLLNAQAGDDLSVGSLAGGISLSSKVSSGGVITITLTGSASLADYQNAIKAITFSSSGQSIVDRVVTVKVNDGDADSNTAYTTITVSPDSRPVTVMGTEVNEASPYLMFEVAGVEGQWVSLALGTTGSGEGHASMGTDFLPNLQYFNGSAWVDYTGGLVQIPDTAADNGKLLVRTAVLQDSDFETTLTGYETLKLTAYNAAGTPNTIDGIVDSLAEGMAQIRDDGQGSIFLGNNNGSNNALADNSSGDIDPNGPDYPDYLDDDRPVTVDSIVVNEASSWAMFTVSGSIGQIVSLAPHNGTATAGDGDPADGSEDYGPSLQYWNGSTWTAYNGSSVTLSGTTLLVRTAIHQDDLFEGQHAFSLGVTKVSSDATVYGTANIYDDGTGNKYLFDNVNDGTATITSGPGAGFDDDRLLTVDSPTVNEASDYVVFTLTGNSGQTASLALVDESSNGTVAGKANIVDNQTLMIWDGLSWVDYDANNLPTFDANGKIFVRVDIAAEQDTPYEGSETFKLNATLTGQSAVVSGTATIKDDGTGTIFTGALTLGAPATDTDGPFDDDRTGPGVLSVNSISVNEASPYAIFEVSGAANQLASLALASGASNPATGDGIDYGLAAVGSDLQYWDGDRWENYISGTVALNANGKLLVRTAITNDSIFDNNETFKLVATNTNNATAEGTAIIKDDGTGTLFTNENPEGDNPPTDGDGPFDDDRTLAVNSISVNENSPYAVFTIQANIGETLSLSFGNGTVNGTATGSGTDYGSNGADGLNNLQYYNGNNWVDYTGGFTVPGSGTGATALLVRTSIKDDSVFEGAEDFKLSATYTSGGSRSAEGTATIRDDGTGALYPDNTSGTTGSGALDDDRSITVSGGTYNENSPRAVFTVNANLGQLLTFDVRDVAGSGKNPTGDNEGGQGDALDNAAIYYSLDGGATWSVYDGTPVTAGSSPVLVAVNITAEQDDVFEGEEQFQLLVNPGQPNESAGFASIFDNGSGDITRVIDQGTINDGGVNDPVIVKDDDRPEQSVSLPPNASQIVEFNGSQSPLNTIHNDNTLQPGAPGRNSGNAIRPENYDWHYGLIDWPGISLSGDRDHYHQVWGEPRVEILEAWLDLSMEQGRQFAIPPEALMGLDANDSLRFDAQMANGDELPQWIHFDRNNGSLQINENAPIGQDKQVVKVVATDTKGNQVTVTVILKPKNAKIERPQGKPHQHDTALTRPSGKPAISEQISHGGSHGLQRDAADLLNQFARLFNDNHQA